MNSDTDEWLVNDHKRYLVKIPYFYKAEGHIVYQTDILDSAYNRRYVLFFRFKTLRNFHQQLEKQAGENIIPEYPKTNSFGLWHRTNRNLPLIKQRVRELEYYLTQVLNAPKIMNLPEARLFRTAFRRGHTRETRSASCNVASLSNRTNSKECPELYMREFSCLNLH